MKIVKVGIKDSKVFVHAEEEIKGEVKKIMLDGDTPPLPEFPKAFGEVCKYMTEFMNFPDDWKGKVTTVSIGHEEDKRKNVVVTMSVKMPNFVSPTTINTPVLREKIAGTSNGGAFMMPKLLELVEEVIKQGHLYLDGERGQVEMPLEEENGPRTNKKSKKLTDKEVGEGQAAALAAVH